MKDTMKEGVEYTLEFKVTESKTVPELYPESELFASMPRVFATGYMVGFMEWACMEALAPHLDDGEHSVGVSVNFSHVAATPPGMMVKAIAKCTGVEGQKTSWYIEAYDEQDLIGKGTHDRFTINVDRFNQKLEKKGI
ncbi:MAG: thioesterase [Denitrovibrio sp.]|nr:MAG: thioesterase [Denitrovibrio sp.]